jgi:hypothetical protein
MEQSNKMETKMSTSQEELKNDISTSQDKM